MKLSVVTHAFNAIDSTASRLEKTQELARLFKKATPHEAAIISYISLGELYPPYRDFSFNIAEKSLVPVIARLLHVDKAVIKKQLKNEGDLGAVVSKGSWLPSGSEVSLSHVYSLLVKIEKVAGTGSQEVKAQQLFELLGELDADSAKYIVRIILGKLRLGFSDMTIIDALSWMEVGDKSLRHVIEHAYNICADIGLIAQTLKQEGVDGLKKMSITVGIPIRPAAAERLPSAQAIFDKIGPCAAQLKLDGFRLQIHVDASKKKPEIAFFSRNLKNMSAMFPELIEAVAQLPVTTLIAEGEAIGYNPETDSFLPFQETVKRKRKHGIEQASQSFPLKLFLFDLLYVDGVSWLDKPHEKRYAELNRLVQHDPRAIIQCVEEKKITTVHELESFFYHAIHEGLEGLVVKRMHAPYQPGSRNFNWIKLKRQEGSEVEDTIDCVILGYYHGSGKRASFGIGAFLVGVFNKEEDRFETVAKIGTGLSDEHWIHMRQRLDTIKVTDQPSNVWCHKDLYPDVWVAPEIVCVIRADEITQSPMHTAGKTAHTLGFALRFPRFISYRDDKSPEDITTVRELKQLYKNQRV